MTRPLFSRIAGVYDRMNHVLSLGLDIRWRKKAVRSVQGAPRRILDLACGTGDLTFALARRFPNASIVGLDLTPEMLAVARLKNTSTRIAFREGNAEALPFETLSPNTQFDLITCAFGFRNFPDKTAALREARRVLADGGGLLVLEFFRPRSRVLGRFTSIWLRLLGAVFCRKDADAYAYLRTSMERTISEGEFVDLAENEGFRLAERAFFLPCCTCLRFRLV